MRLCVVDGQKGIEATQRCPKCEATGVGAMVVLAAGWRCVGGAGTMGI